MGLPCAIHERRRVKPLVPASLSQRHQSTYRVRRAIRRGAVGLSRACPRGVTRRRRARMACSCITRGRGAPAPGSNPRHHQASLAAPGFGFGPWWSLRPSKREMHMSENGLLGKLCLIAAFCGAALRHGAHGETQCTLQSREEDVMRRKLASCPLSPQRAE